MNIVNRLETYRAGNAVQRLHVVRHLMPYTNGQHSANAALIAMELCEANQLPSATVVKYMLLHDVAEGYIGDLPANVKWDNPVLSAALADVEHRWNEEHLDMPMLSIMEAQICKFADMAELGMYCIEELGFGNRHVLPMYRRVIVAMQQRQHGILGASEITEYLISRGAI